MHIPDYYFFQKKLKIHKVQKQGTKRTKNKKKQSKICNEVAVILFSQIKK
jgi:hypothetical protein